MAAGPKPCLFFSDGERHAQRTRARIVRFAASRRSSSSTLRLQRGTKTRDGRLVPRNNDEAYLLDLTADVLAAVDWHVAAGHGRSEFLFTKTSIFPRYVDSHVRPLTLVQQKLGLRVLSHHKAWRHSVGSQAVTGGKSLKAGPARSSFRAEHASLCASGRRSAAPARRVGQNTRRTRARATST
jgi:hypothetical protein